MERTYDVVVRSYGDGFPKRIRVKVDGARVAAEKAARKASGFSAPHVIGIRRVHE